LPSTAAFLASVTQSLPSGVRMPRRGRWAARISIPGIGNTFSVSDGAAPLSARDSRRPLAKTLLARGGDPGESIARQRRGLGRGWQRLTRHAFPDDVRLRVLLGPGFRAIREKSCPRERTSRRGRDIEICIEYREQKGGVTCQGSKNSTGERLPRNLRGRSSAYARAEPLASTGQRMKPLVDPQR
jgi:hypothetical protein